MKFNINKLLKKYNNFWIFQNVIKILLQKMNDYLY